ncbi:beta-ketoacyl synthase N-terminal-like domain-containing protein [Actinobacillus vicugnae]|uniref:beta-ketoacyl synthase N-terminal-like domain-containing protein n=1 Tax=Actinobacillus vicugnae TaxID=2573093 RepID=UPI001240A249|nr:beta-ketoacyl synthase N-terminal-like domain-containing protein [Actinobacillus vicugnae]
MTVYINASGRISADICKSRTALQLGQSVELPYFSAFEQQCLNLEQLYILLERQIEQCVLQAGWEITELAGIPILLGSTAYTIADCEYRVAHQQTLPSEPNLAVIGNHLQQKYGAKLFNFATSCTSSAQAIGYAVKMIEQGKCDRALVVGFEMFNRLTFEHFQAMGLLAQNANEKGIVLGEGIGCVALSNQPSDCQILGVASLTDHESLTNNSETALASLISKILQKSDRLPAEIQAVKAHFVGSEFDETEQALLQKVLPNRPLLFPKQELGHTLGASGALETAWLLEYLQKNSGSRPFLVLNYFLGFGGSNIGWLLQWK